MKILPAVLTRLRSRKPGPGKKGPEVSAVAAAALSLLAIVIVFIVGEAYLSRVTLTVDERSTILSTLLLCDVLIFCISLLITAILWYLSSLNYGNREGLLSVGALPLYGILMLLPIVFVACDLSFKPLFFSMVEVEVALALSVIGIMALVPYSIAVLEQIKPRGILAGLVEDIEKELKRAGRKGPVEPVALQRPVLRGSAGTRLASLLDKLCRSGDQEPVQKTLEQMKGLALSARGNDMMQTAASAGMVSMIAETAFIAARRGSTTVVYRALDGLRDVAEASPHQGIASLAFRSMGGVYSFCTSCMDERPMSRLGTKMMENYARLYDRTGRREAIELAAAIADKAGGTRMLATEEYDGILYVSGGVYRRLAEADDSEEHANKALTLLFEALTARTADASPLDHACIKGEIGRAYMALARIKNPVKSYRSAASEFEDAGRMLNAKISPWDSALYRGKAACAYTMLADEYCRGKRYDDALQAARSALALYPEAVKFFEKRSPEDLVEVSSSQGFAHTIVSEVYLRSRMFDLSLKHASLALDAYSLASNAIDIKIMPERYASIRTNIGLTHVNMAEIHFREKRYESAITACDSAIAAYNEAIRIYDERKKDKPAAATKKHLKKANDLFNTMMRIGVADRKPLAPVVGQ
jgi:tetratricopeptide (TPR) repeat protein